MDQQLLDALIKIAKLETAEIQHKNCIDDLRSRIAALEKVAMAKQDIAIDIKNENVGRDKS